MIHSFSNEVVDRVNLSAITAADFEFNLGDLNPRSLWLQHNDPQITTVLHLVGNLAGATSDVISQGRAISYILITGASLRVLHFEMWQLTDELLQSAMKSILELTVVFVAELLTKPVRSCLDGDPRDSGASVRKILELLDDSREFLMRDINFVRSQLVNHRLWETFLIFCCKWRDCELHFPFKIMVTISEETSVTGADTPNFPGAPAPTKWNFSPLQAIPRNPEALWNLIDTVYFANVPAGNEVLECLRSIINEDMSEPAPPVPEQVQSARLYYTRDPERAKPREELVPRFTIDVLSDEGTLSVLYSDTLLPLVKPPSRKLQAKSKSDQQSGVAAPSPTWTCVDSSSETPMTELSETDLERQFLQAELAKITEKKKAIVKSILAKMEAEIRPNRKAWFEAEQNLLALYEKKPPSSFQSTGSATAEIKEQPLSALGKVDSELPDSFKDAELCCSICGEGDTADDNDILICDGCCFAAHQSCYFVKDIPDGSWFCQLCESFYKSKGGGGRKNSRRINEPGSGLDQFLGSSITCSLCLQSASFVGGGLMKPTSTGGWAHVKCALWVPEAAFPADGLTITVIPNKERENLRCTICKLKGGAPLQCAFGKCIAAFHVSCAARSGLLPEEKNLKNLFCTRHMKIQLKMSPCTSRLLSLRKQDSYLKWVNDKHIASKIGGSLFTLNFNPKVDGEQSFLLQIAGVHPSVLKEISGPGFLGPQDLLDADQTGPLLKDWTGDLVSFPVLAAERGGPTEMGRDTFVDISCCSECMRPVSEERDLIVKCSTCGLFAHSFCYDRAGVPVPNVDDLTLPALQRVLKYSPSKKWSDEKNGIVSITCARCEMVNNGTVSAMVRTHCVLCMQMGGLVLPLQDLDDDENSEEPPTTSPSHGETAFAHPRCVWWLLASSIVNLTSTPPMQLRSIAASYHFHACAVCGSRQGCTVRCTRVGCNRRFHISCGFHAGAYFSVRTATGLIAGCRDYEDDVEGVLDNLGQVVSGQTVSRRVVTCWSHEQRGMRRIGGNPQLGRVMPIKAELIRWVPEGIKSELVSLVNRVLSGEVGVSIAGILESKPPRPKPSSRAIKDEGSGSEAGDHRPKRKRGRPRLTSKQEEGDMHEKIQTVRFVDGMEVTCEDEDWEGGCPLCGKAWTDSKGQVLESICCDKCDSWYHFSCVGIQKAPTGEYVCPVCR